MKILSITAGAAGMYCGSCLRDNALAAELIARGHEVTLLPLYTPLLTDEPNVSRPEVLFGGISVYLQQWSRLFSRLPRIVDRLLDSPRVIKAFADRTNSTNPKLLGALTVSMLEGADGVLRKEFDKLVDWTREEAPPDVVSLTNSMLIGLARPLREAFGRPVVCTLQGEDLFLEGLVEPYKSRALGLLREQVRHVDRFIAVSEYYARFMSRYLQIPGDRISVVPLGINMSGFDRAGAHSATAGSGESAARLAEFRVDRNTFTIGYMARVAPEKGLQLLAEAYQRFRSRTPQAKARLEAAGYMAPEFRGYLADVQRTLERAGLGHEFHYRGTVDRAEKVAFLHTLDVLSLPATYDEPKGFALLEAMAVGVPVVQPRRGSFTEVVERTGGGLLVESDAASLADGFYSLWENRALRDELGRKGFDGVRQHYTIQRSADRLLAVYEELHSQGRAPLTAKAAS
jgi:glycosyltransferase involved in cell wall biosynthesis